MISEELKSFLLKNQSRISKKTLRDLPQPNQLKNNILAAKRILELLFSGKKMLIVGDYDADGIFATTILYSFLLKVGFADFINYIIPSRLKDGYGLSPNIIHYAKDNNFDFIVTVDNGIAAIEAIELANKLNIEVIITDHHTAPKTLPNASIIVNPKVPGETFPFIDISGATVAWYLVAALKKELNSSINITQYLDYVAITIISDVMPLNDINIPLLKLGLSKIKERNREFYKLLWNDWVAPTINETSVGFNLVPMINAIGRIDNANIGVELFISENKKEIKKYFDFLKSINEKRKEMSREYIKEAELFIASSNIQSKNVIIVRNKNFHEGIVGIIAGKLAEKYKRPAYVFTYNKEKNIWKGSARSYGEVHLYNLTNTVSELLSGFGGHKGAVGLALTEENFNSFQNKLEEETNKLNKELFIDNSTIILDYNLKDIDFELIHFLNNYSPFGEFNPKPKFTTIVKIEIDKELKNGLHYKVKLIDKEKNIFTGLFFNVEKEQFLLDIEKTQKIIFEPTLSYDLRNNSFNIEFICSLDI
jgi:single-stranded-DNA-specific exonuclease